MEIISHRGLWGETIKKNSQEAFINSFKQSYGTETDLRDYIKEIVISHDIADEFCIPASSFFKLYSLYTKKMLALNIKSDGLAAKMKYLIEENNIRDYFFFDMSIPDTISYLRNNLNVFIRQSEYEKDLPFYEECNGIWLDSFIDIWFDENLVLNHINNNKYVCVVSSELHKRETESLWRFLKETRLYLQQKLILCTDLPLEASNFFYNDKINNF